MLAIPSEAQILPRGVHYDEYGNVKAVVGDLASEIAAIRRSPLLDRALFLLTGRLHIGGAAVGAWTFVNTARTNLLNGTFDIDTDSFKCALLTSSSNISTSSTTHAGVTGEVANGNGYTTGGIAVSLTLSGTTTVVVDIATDPVWTASGGSIVARYAEIYEVSGNVLCFSLLDTTPADVTATAGNTFTVAAHATNGVFTLA